LIAGGLPRRVNQIFKKVYFLLELGTELTHIWQSTLFLESLFTI